MKYKTIRAPEKQIDSILKVLRDYPKLITQTAITERILKDLRTLTDDQRTQLLKILGLDAWDFRKVKRRIRWIKFRRWVYAGGGMAVGFVFGVILAVK